MRSVTFQERDFSPAPRLAAASLTVDRLEWRALGGPWSARLSAEGSSLERLWSLTGLLRCGLTVHDERGPAWWGYVSAVEIFGGQRGVRVGLDELANSIAAQYHAFTPDADGGTLAVTPFIRDDRSAQVYGEKQRVIRLGQAGEAEALARARSLLAQLSTPRLRPAPGPGAERLSAWIEARGWWETLDWKIVAEPRGRIADPFSGAGQVFGSPGQERAAQRITMSADPWLAAEVWLRLRRVGQPTDSARLEVCADAAGTPGAVLSAVSLPGGAVGEEWGWQRFVFPAPLALAGSAACWLVLSRTGALAPDAHFLASADEQCRLGGQALVHNGAGWSARVPPADLSLYLNGVEETTEQIRRLLLPERCGPFLRGARIEAPSGVLARLYRGIEESAASDRLRGRAVVEELLAYGKDGGGRLLARIEPDRTARVYAQPQPEQTRLGIGADGVVRDGSRPLAVSEQPAGQWARLADLAPAGAPVLGMEKAVFIERCVWAGGEMRVE